MTKMTYVSAINDVLNGVTLTAVHIDKLNALKTSLEKRATAKGGMTATQKANVGVKERIADFLADGTIRSATEVGDGVGISNQKASALLKQMVEAGTVEKFSEKRKTYFRAISE
jgi:hypothetical protein